ncbi:MAG: exodeoxyribonuclease VII large subunit [Gammaproteobacteria bacterium]
MANSAQASLSRDIYSVTRLNREVRAVLEGSFPVIWVQGEISNLARPGSGHLYFSLKDKHSQVRCAMFKNRNQHLKFSPENGMEIIARANISLYEGRGEFQLIVEQLEPAGIGALQQAFEQLKERLQKEGLFNETHKKPLPAFPRRIGVITSPTGAAIRDILHVLNRRYPNAGVIVYPVAVQGEGSALKISEAISTAGQRNECDILILARGGGSLEDLWSFNEESVARAIFNSRVPIVTGIGHEIDFTIADFVADKRAPTPSAAAELVSPDQFKLKENLTRQEKQLFSSTSRVIQDLQNRLQRCQQRMPDPVKQLQTISQHIDEINLRMVRTMNNGIRNRQFRIHKLQAEINRFNPVQMLRYQRQKCSHLDTQLRNITVRNIQAAKNRFEKASAALHGISPLATIDRGYAIVSEPENGRIIRNIDELAPGKRIETRIAKGVFHSTITDIFKNDN